MRWGKMVQFADEHGLAEEGDTMVSVAPAGAFHALEDRTMALVEPEPCGGGTPKARPGAAHPVISVRITGDRSLRAARVLASFRAMGWTPAMYEYASERAGVAMDNGAPPLRADAIGRLSAVEAFDVGFACETCAHWRRPRGVFRGWGACATLDRATQSGDCCPQIVRRLRVDEVPRCAVRAAEHTLTIGGDA